MVPEIRWYEDESQHEQKRIHADHLFERLCTQISREMRDPESQNDPERIMVAIGGTLCYLTVWELKFFHGTVTAIGIMTDKHTRKIIGDFWIRIWKIDGGTRTACRVRNHTKNG